MATHNRSATVTAVYLFDYSHSRPRDAAATLILKEDVQTDIAQHLAPPKFADGAEVSIADREFQIHCPQLFLKLYPSP